MISCKLIPTRQNINTNKEEDSRLFNSLLSLFKQGDNFRSRVVDMYLRVTNPDFLEKYKDSIVLDELGEPTLGSLLNETDIEMYLDNDKLSEEISKKFPSKDYKDTIDNYNNLVEKAIDFNSNSEYSGYKVALIERVITDKGNTLRITLNEATEENKSRASSMKNAFELNSKIKEILSKHGIKVEPYDQLCGSLTSTEANEYVASKKAANGLSTIIKLANNSLGTASLPEEFSHYIVETFSDDPIMQRILSAIKKYDLSREILNESYNSYYKKYDGNQDKLNHEAAAKLVRDKLFADNEVNANLENLVNRLRNVFKNKFSTISDVEIDSIINNLTDTLNSLSSKIFNNIDDLKTSVNRMKGSFNDINEKIQRDIRILESIIDVEVKKAYIYDKTADKSWKDKRAAFIKNLKSKQVDPKNIQPIGIYIFLEQVSNEFSKLLDRVNNIENPYNTVNNNLHDINNQAITIQAKLLRQIINYTSSYSEILKDIQHTIRINKSEDPNYYNIEYNGNKIDIESLVDKCVGNLNHLNRIYEDKGAELFLEFLKPFFGENIVVPFDNAIKGAKKGDIVSAETFYDYAKKEFMSVPDISFLDRWLNNMSSSHDWFNKMFASIVKQQNTKTRLETIETTKRLQAAAMKLESKGIKDFSFVYERDSDGNLTLNFISEINWGQYRADKRKNWEDLQKKYGNFFELSEEDKKKFKKERSTWIKAHSHWDKKRGMRTPNYDLYHNKEFDKLKEDTDRYNFYKTIVKIKSELDKNLPISGQARHQVPIIMKDILERVKSAGNLKDGYTAILESARDEVFRRSGDIGYGSDEIDMTDEDYDDEPYINRPLDFEGNPINTLPIYYQRLRGDVYDKKTGKLIQRGDNANDVSTDIISAMCAYAQMAHNYSSMNEVIDIMEIGRDALDEGQKISITDGDAKIVEKIKKFGHSIHNEGQSNKGSNIKQQRDDFFLAHVYGRYFANAGTKKILGKQVDLNKLANLSNKATSLNGLAFNPLAGIANIDQGIITMNIEAASKEFFTTKNTFHADLKYGELLPASIAEIGDRIKTNKLDLLSEKFNVLQDYDKKVQEMNFDRRSWLSRMYGSNFLYAINNAGEHWMQHRTFFALCDSENEKLVDESGQKISIDEAYEVKFRQKDGSYGDADQGLGAKISLKEGLSNQDGIKIIKEEQMKAGHKLADNEMDEWMFINYFSRKCATINQRMHGIYNTEDMNAFQRLAVGRMVMIFRKWIVPSIEKRYDTVNYNFETKSWNEGYYRTSVRVLGRLINDVRKGQFVYATFKDQMTDMEKQNMRRCIAEVAQFSGIIASLMIIGQLDDDDKASNNGWLLSILEYKLRRMRTEIGALMPTPLLPTELFRLVQMPSADVRVWQTTLDILNLANPLGWRTDEDHVLKSGRFKGHSQNYKHLHNSIIFPIENDMYNIMHPEEALSFYK